MEPTTQEAVAQLTEMTEDAGLENLRLRHGFVRRDSTRADNYTSDRKAPPRERRPSATRVLSPNGIALSFHLTALLEAQTRTAPGDKAGDNPMALRGTAGQRGWTDLVATAATTSGLGRTRSTVNDKHFRQIRSALQRLRDENLVDLPNADAAQGKNEGFMLTMEDERRRPTHDLYRVPDQPDSFFTVPLTLFTNGWIYILEDTELALLLITARNRHLHGDEAIELNGEIRSINHGLGQDAFKAHRVLDYLGLIDVIADWRRHHDGTVSEYETKGADAHKLLFHPDALNEPAISTFLTKIEDQLARPEPGPDTD
jgi:hypothetical protein